MATTTTQTVEDSVSTRRFSMSSLWSSRSEITLTPSTQERQPPVYIRKYFQPDPNLLASASDATILDIPVHERHVPRRRTLHVLGRMNDRLMSGVGPDEEFRILRMSKLEYTRYWARDEEGRYIGTEPEGKGAERLKAGGW